MTRKNQAQMKMPKPPAAYVPDFYRQYKQPPSTGPISRQQADIEIAHAVEMEHNRAMVVLTLQALAANGSSICQRAYDLATIPPVSQRSELLAEAGLYKKLGDIEMSVRRVFMTTTGWDEETRALSQRLFLHWSKALSAAEAGDGGEAIRELAASDEYGIEIDSGLVDLAGR